MLNAEPQPPDIELREAVNPGRRERYAIVGANRVRQAVFAEQPVEHRPHAEPLGREQAVTREQVARVLVGHRERVTVHAVAGAKVALEVRGPEIIGVRRHNRHDARMLVVATPAAFLDQPLARQEVPRGADGRQIDGGMARTQPIEQLVRPPVRMLPSGRADQRRHLVGDLVRTPPWRAAAIAKSIATALIESVQPLVARFPTNAVPRTQLHHVVQGQLVIANEAFSLFHRCRLQPGHRSTSQSIPSVAVSPMFPV